MIRKDNGMFEDEKNVLQSAMATIADSRYCDNELLMSYKGLVDNYQKLLKTTAKIFRVSDCQELMLQRWQNDLQNLLDNSHQGFLTFGRDLKVDQQYSAECIKIFGKKIAGSSIVSLLSQENNRLRGQVQAILERVFLSNEAVGQTELQWLPAIFQIGDKRVCVECKILPQTDHFIERFLVMMVLTDITEKLRAEEQIRFLSYYDKLTTLHNRSYVEGTLVSVLEKRGNLPLSVIMADMNGLKLVNDVFGHHQGDLLLKAIANVLKNSCRQTDIIVRWGGDEFVILMPNTDETTCGKVCEEIRDACDASRDCAITLSASLGAATKVSGDSTLAELLAIAEGRMYNDKLIRSREFRRSIVANLEDMLISRCFVDAGHSERTLQLATDFIEFLGIDKNTPDIKPLNQLCVLHDIGKVALPSEILGKPGPLLPDEWTIIKNHSEIGYRLAQSIGEPMIAEIILALHERWDGSGYPFGIKGEQIPLLVRIFSLVDTYDSMIHDRSYKMAVDKGAALKEIESAIGSQFDPKLAQAFLTFMNNKSEMVV